MQHPKNLSDRWAQADTYSKLGCRLVSGDGEGQDVQRVFRVSCLAPGAGPAIQVSGKMGLGTRVQGRDPAPRALPVSRILGNGSRWAQTLVQVASASNCLAFRPFGLEPLSLFVLRL
jgi:hypothetical protein